MMAYESYEKIRDYSGMRRLYVSGAWAGCGYAASKNDGSRRDRDDCRAWIGDAYSAG
jgi:hypothetical protein